MVQCGAVWCSVIQIDMGDDLRDSCVPAVWVDDNAMQCGAVWCGVVRCGAVWCGVVRCGAVGCGVVRCGAVWCGVVRCGAVCSSVLNWHGRRFETPVCLLCDSLRMQSSVLQCVSLWCSVVRCDTVCDEFIYTNFFFSLHILLRVACCLHVLQCVTEWSNSVFLFPLLLSPSHLLRFLHLPPFRVLFLAAELLGA